MPVSDQFIAIMPRHQRLLKDLWEQRKVDQHGCIGWRGLMDEDEQFTPEQLFAPLLDRGLIEDMRNAFEMESGKHFVRITAIGIACMNFGQMLREPRTLNRDEFKLLSMEEPNGGRPEPKTIEAGNTADQARG